MKIRKAKREGIERGAFYPEPATITRRPAAAFWYRFLLGRPMDGQRWTDSTFWRSATRGEDHWWLRLAGWQRSLMRCSALYLLLLLPVLSLLMAFGGEAGAALVLRLLLLHVVVLLAPVLLLLDLYFIKEHGIRLPWRVELEQEPRSEEEEISLKGEAPVLRRWRMATVVEGRRNWEREIVQPLATVAAEVLGLSSHPGEARRWVHVPRDYAEPGGGAVEILLPRKFTASEQKKKALLAAVRPRLGMMELRDQWLLQGRHPRLLLSAPPAPPALALFSAYQDLLEQTEEYRPALGVVSSGELLSAEMVSDSPHLALSAGSGAGKSMLMRSIIMQVLRWGWCVVILDWKEESHEWARGLPGVRYASTPEQIHDTLVSVGEEISYRKSLSKEKREQLPRVLVVREEWNMTAALLAEYWSALRSTAEPEERKTMPARSPALSAAMMLDFAGRSFGMFDLLAAQRMSNRVFNGNADIRENFGIRLLARYTVQTWKMLVPHLKYLPKPKELGRWIVAAGEEATYVQGILISEEEAQEFARGGIPNPASPWAARRPNVGTLNVPMQEDQLPVRVTTGNYETTSHAAIEGDPIPSDKMMSLRDLEDVVAPFRFTLKDLQRAASGGAERDVNFPPVLGGTQFKGYLYGRDAVVRWAREKRAAQAAEKEMR